jgi:hypothetical protein
MNNYIPKANERSSRRRRKREIPRVRKEDWPVIREGNQQDKQRGKHYGHQPSSMDQ